MIFTRIATGARAAVVAALTFAAAQASATAHRFELAVNGGPLISFEIADGSVPTWFSEGSFEISGLSLSILDPGAAATEAAGGTFYAYVAEWNGGADLSTSRGDEFGFFGPQLFGGDTSAPLFAAGVYELDGGTLTISEVSPVAEPGEWAMLGAGLSLVGFAARRRAK